MNSKSEEYTMNGVPVTMHENGIVYVGRHQDGEPIIRLVQWFDKETNEYVITGTLYHESQKSILEKAMPKLNITPNGIIGQWNVRSR